MTPKPFLVDSHCHLQYLEPDARAAAVARARTRGVDAFLIPATRLEQAEELVAWCRANENTWCALGVHPHDAASWNAGDERRLAELVADPHVVAVGECGLDFYYDHAPRDVQEDVLRAQWRIAVAAGLPAIVHNRDSNERMLALFAVSTYLVTRESLGSTIASAIVVGGANLVLIPYYERTLLGHELAHYLTDHYLKSTPRRQWERIAHKVEDALPATPRMPGRRTPAARA